MSRRISEFGRFGVYSPYECPCADGRVGWTVQRFDPASDDPEEPGELVAEFIERDDAELFANAKMEMDTQRRSESRGDKYRPHGRRRR